MEFDQFAVFNSFLRQYSAYLKQSRLNGTTDHYGTGQTDWNVGMHIAFAVSRVFVRESVFTESVAVCLHKSSLHHLCLDSNWAVMEKQPFVEFALPERRSSPEELVVYFLFHIHSSSGFYFVSQQIILSIGKSNERTIARSRLRRQQRFIIWTTMLYAKHFNIPKMTSTAPSRMLIRFSVEKPRQKLAHDTSERVSCWCLMDTGNVFSITPKF